MAYLTMSGEEIDLAALEAECPEQVKYLGQDLAGSTSWTEFMNRSGFRVTQYTQKRLGMEAWQSHPLYKLKMDLMGQLGVFTKEMRGENTSSFQEFRARFV